MLETTRVKTHFETFYLTSLYTVVMFPAGKPSKSFKIYFYPVLCLH